MDDNERRRAKIEAGRIDKPAKPAKKAAAKKKPAGKKK